MAATGMNVSTGLGPCGKVGSGQLTGASPGSFIEP
ncbi:Uncharacterised protein [Mycobacteroides abscessus]|nr:Uncharacterised protein [Mycobacteroides abscessus]SHU41110.1 Uncharacterised protein [Mycobacteroides abscessus subsp. abscessus]SHZ94113.1 Uncharacterised protein [Mycobacteroides abscessus subsp. abscessus]SKT76272.1 Uncharacterised protein [Mycobacteroides abscessus subsp. abscessus]